MMRRFYTVVLERMKYFSEGFATEPYEVGWASEAVFFVRVHELLGQEVKLDSFVQLSVDGIHWIDEGSRLPPIGAIGDYFVKVTGFGGWLRLRSLVTGKDPELRLTIHLALKE